MRLWRWVALCTVLLGALPAAAESFDRVPILEKNVAFWRKVYAVWSINDIALHDREDLGVIFRVVRVPGHGRRGKDGLTRSQSITKAKKELVVALDSLAKKKPKSAAGLKGLELEVYNNLKGVARADKYTRPRDLIRGQNGLYERARKGWIAMGRYEKGVRREIEKSGMPQDILALAFLESLFNINAVSHAGATGMWQFMRPTGKEFMHVNHVVDERRDPILATEAAMKYLKSARRLLKKWPLAITSYNYGRAGMKRASNAVGSDDFGVIYKTYKNGRFGFAAKNYYASFLALLDVIRAPEKYFGSAKRAPAWRYDVIRLPFPVLAPQLYKLGVIDEGTLRSYNPALTKNARNGVVVLPQGLPMRVPYGKGGGFLKKVAALSFPERKRAMDHVGRWHRANGRQSVATIAKRYGVSLNEVVALTGYEKTDTPAKGTQIPIPSRQARYTLFPEARGIAIPDAPRLPQKVAAAPREIPIPPEPKKRRTVARRDDGPQVKLVRMTAVRIEPPLPAVDLIGGGDTPPVGLVDIVAGEAGAFRASRAAKPAAEALSEETGVSEAPPS